jgi:chromosome segregation ATPase
MSAETMVPVMALGIVKATERIQELERERDEARAEVERLRTRAEAAERMCVGLAEALSETGGLTDDESEQVEAMRERMGR